MKLVASGRKILVWTANFIQLYNEAPVELIYEFTSKETVSQITYLPQ